MPDSERERRLEEIYSAALKEDASRRPEFLRQACGGDSALCQEIESLLGDERELGDFLAKPALEGAGSGVFGGQGRPMVGHTLGPYDVLSLLGAGGMGEVYSARDTRLGRVVALKVLQPDVAADPKRQRRLLVEAKAASALNDPRIVALYDVGRADGIDFLVMEYVEGETLDKLIPPGGLEARQALAYALEIGAGLETAHSAGIVHRDLKPGNIMITGKGAVKVLDFGLAKLAEAQASDGSGNAVSMAGLILGTAAYMSPEQARGQPVDARSDIFSFGVVLYEMLTGQRPFQGADRLLTLAAIVQQEPKALTRVNPDLPVKLEEIVKKALAKERDRRYQSTAEMLSDLRSVPREMGSRQGVRPKAAAAVALVTLLLVAAAWFYLRWRQSHQLTDNDSIVLADFTNTTGDSVFDGTLRQGLSAQLEQSPFLSLLSDSRVAQTLVLMTQPKDARLTQKLAREVCQRTASAATIEGSISSTGSQYVLGLRAVNCRSGDLLAEEQVTAHGKAQVLPALGEAATKMRRKLGESLASVQKYDVPPKNVTTGSLEALQAYSLGWRVQVIRHDDFAAIPLLQRAASLDPNFAMAFATLGAAYSNMGETARGAQNLTRAHELRERVSQRERFYIESFYEMDVTGNLEADRKVLELFSRIYPRDPAPPNHLASVWCVLGEYQKALAAAQEELKLLPGSAVVYEHLTCAYRGLNRLDEARATAREAHNRGAPGADGDLYGIDFLQHDAAGMERDIAALMAKPGYEAVALGLESGTAEYAGKFAKARELMRRAVASATRAGEPEIAAGYLASFAGDDALVGNLGVAKQQARAALELSHGRSVETGSAAALAIAGEAGEARRLVGDLAKRFPEDTIIQIESLPLIQAYMEVSAGGAMHAVKAIEVLKVPARYEMSDLEGPYLRGEAYLSVCQGASAAAEFQKFLDHPGVVGNSVMGELAHLGLGRAYALAGDHAKARIAYQDFLALWKDADPDIPVLKQAKAEYAKLVKESPAHTER